MNNSHIYSRNAFIPSTAPMAPQQQVSHHFDHTRMNGSADFRMSQHSRYLEQQAQQNFFDQRFSPPSLYHLPPTPPSAPVAMTTVLLQVQPCLPPLINYPPFYVSSRVQTPVMNTPNSMLIPPPLNVPPPPRNLSFPPQQPPITFDASQALALTDPSSASSFIYYNRFTSSIPMDNLLLRQMTPNFQFMVASPVAMSSQQTQLNNLNYMSRQRVPLLHLPAPSRVSQEDVIAPYGHRNVTMRNRNNRPRIWRGSQMPFVSRISRSIRNRHNELYYPAGASWFSLFADTSLGLSNSELDSLPQREFKQVSCDKDENKSADEEKCMICLENYENKAMLRTLSCVHEFHTACIDIWLKSHRTCPLCRADAVNGKHLEDLDSFVSLLLAARNNMI